MIHVTNNKENTIKYKCECGTRGFCTIKPYKEDAALVVDIKCPNCSQVERIVMLQYSSEENKKKILENLNNTEFKWSHMVGTDMSGDDEND